MALFSFHRTENKNEYNGTFNGCTIGSSAGNEKAKSDNKILKAFLLGAYVGMQITRLSLGDPTPLIGL